jgi:hypothetical protein
MSNLTIQNQIFNNIKKQGADFFRTKDGKEFLSLAPGGSYADILEDYDFIEAISTRDDFSEIVFKFENRNEADTLDLYCRYGWIKTTSNKGEEIKKEFFCNKAVYALAFTEAE